MKIHIRSIKYEMRNLYICKMYCALKYILTVPLYIYDRLFKKKMYLCISLGLASNVLYGLILKSAYGIKGTYVRN